jgi:hypothetical protein
MFVVGNAVLEDSIARVHFACDLSACKGACCCLEGGRGAPLTDDEVHEVEAAIPVVSGWLSEKALDIIRTQGAFEGVRGDFATRCVDERECVFVYREGDVAKCAIERAFNEGLVKWQKPVSCHLFPIRVRKFGSVFLRYEEIEECSGGRARGRNEKTDLSAFLRRPLTRVFGEEWYLEFTSTCDAQRQEDTD